MTPTVLIRHIDEAIIKAIRHQSWIDESVLGITGFSTGVMRRLISNICHLPKASGAYLEVGLYAGATLCAAINNNPTLDAVGIEDFSQSFGKEGISDELDRNIIKYRCEGQRVDIINADCFTIKPRTFLKEFDVFTYDGCHDFAPQAQALPYFFYALADVFVFIVDDFHWSTVREGTAAGFEELKDRVKIEKTWALDGEKQQDDPVFWNGMQIYVCSKV